MTRKITMVSIGLLLVAAGWVAAGGAQDTRPDLEFTVTARDGSITVECVSGCGLAWVERGRTRGGATKPTFTFSCRAGDGTTAKSCASGKVGGWIKNIPATDTK